MNFRTGRNTQCDFALTEALLGQAQCSVFSQEGIAYNVNRCIDTNVGSFRYLDLERDPLENLFRVFLLPVITTVKEWIPTPL